MMSRGINIFVVAGLCAACATEGGHPRAPSETTEPSLDAGVETSALSSQTPDASASDGSSGASAHNDAAASEVMDAGVVTPTPTVTCGDLTCDEFAACVGAEETRCVCALGLEGDGQRCTDINECETDPEVCGANATCENTFGAHSCRCNGGYTLDNGVCVADDVCATASPCADDATCSVADGQVTCVCNEGFFGNGFYCSPDDPCADDPCGAEGQCTVVGGAERNFVCACSTGFSGGFECAACGLELTLEDPELAKAVRAELGLEEDDSRVISLQELAQHTALDASRFNVTDLTGLECWSNLQALDLSYNASLGNEGAAALTSLNQLEELRLDCTQITDLSVLEGHPNLGTLSLNALNCDEPTRLDSVSVLPSLAQLTVLDLRGQKLTDFSALVPLANLRGLWLGYNELGSLRDLPPLPLLTELDVSVNRLQDLDGVERFLRLQYLNVSNNKLESLEQTRALTGLRSLTADQNRIAELPDFRAQVDLLQIDVSSNQLTSLVALADVERTAWVNVASNSIPTLAPLLKGSLRGTLVVAGNPLPCSTEAQTMAELRSLGIDVLGDCAP